MKLWGSGCQSSLHLQCQDSQAWFKLETKLGHPASPHVFPPFPVHGDQHDHHQQKSRRRKGPVHLQNDRERAAAHRAKLAATDLSSLPSVATADTSTSASDAVSAVSALPPLKTPIPLVASTGNSCPPQPRPAVSAGPEPLPLPPPPPPTPPPPRTASPPRTPSPCPEESGSAETVAVTVSATDSAAKSEEILEDEVCPDDEYQKKAATEFVVVHATVVFENSQVLCRMILLLLSF